MQEEIRILEEQSEIDVDRIEEKKVELQNILKEKLQGIMIRARIRWTENGEKPYKIFFCNLDSRNFVIKTVTKVVKEDGSIINK